MFPSDLLLLRCAKKISPYSCGLIRVRKNAKEPEDRQQLIGSGTFVSIGNKKGILTAHHVAEEFEESDILSVSLVPDGQFEHSHEMSFNSLSWKKIARGSNKYDGPDLAFIILPKEKVGFIKAYKLFFDLSGYREGMLNNRPPSHSGMWFIHGYIGEHTKTERSEINTRPINVYEEASMSVDFIREDKQDDFDYIEVNTGNYDEKSPPPISFGGISGGGLWFIRIKESKEDFEPYDVILSGVAFSQSKRKDQKRVIRCHGVNSLYRNVCDTIANKS